MAKVVVTDDFGVDHTIQAHVGLERCPLCQGAYPKHGDQVDLNAAVRQLIDSLHAEADAVVAAFEGWGADMSKEKAAIAARNASPSNNQAGH